MEQPLSILFENDDLIAINKPHGLLVHKTPIAMDVDVVAVQLLRDQIGKKVFPPHRLDRKTSGVLLFAKNYPANAVIQQLFREGKVSKTYRAIVRGFTDETGLIDYALKKEHRIQEAQTAYQTLQYFEIPLAFGQHATSRYSLVELKPLTGRFHQLRKHMAHIDHPIIGDRPHGCNKQNKLWKNHFRLSEMLLHATQLEFEFPKDQTITIQAPYSAAFVKALHLLNHYDDLSLGFTS